MATYGPYLFAGLLAIAVITIFRAIWLFVPRRDVVADRLANYGTTDFSAMLDENALSSRKRRLSLIERLENGFGLGPGLAKALSQSDLPLTVAEFLLIEIIVGGIGLLLGSARLGMAMGIVVGLLAASLPVLYLRIAMRRRLQSFNNQLPDVLTMLVGALRSGYGLTQAITTLVEQMPSPSSVEFARVTRAVNLGVSIQQALTDMAERVDSDDLSLVVTAINVQYEVGGNLSQVLDNISETIRERIRILREVRVLTAQQRLSSYVLSSIPIGLCVIISFINPTFFDPFFEPGPARILPFFGITTTLLGFVIMRRIVDIRV